MENEEKIPSIELRTEKVQEILGHIPHWIVRWGMLTFFIAISFLLVGSYIFKYPHIVYAQMKVTTENPPSNAVARTDGRISNIFVEDNQFVVENEVLAIIENAAEYKEVMQLSSLLDSIQYLIGNPDSLSEISIPTFLRLGSVQAEFSNFLKNFTDIRNFISLNYHNQKIGSLENEIERFRAYSWTHKKQSNILRQERALSQNQFNRDSTLYRQGVIPEAEYEKSRASLLQKQRAYEESRSVLVNTDIEITRLEQQILDLKLQKNNENDNLRLSLQESYENLVAAIADWDQKFVLRTNVSGIVSFTRIWSENQNVSTGEMVMTVIPENSGEIIGRLELAPKNSGKVKVDQEVNIKFENFPYMEYGIVKGKIKSISLLTDNNAYSVLVNFPNGLITNYGRDDIIFSQDMKADAEIITNEESLLERIINPVKSVILRQKELSDN